MVIKNGQKTIGVIEDNTFKKKIKESKHLLWSKGGVPAIDAEAFDARKGLFRTIVMDGEKRRFIISKSVFDDVKQEIDLGYGRQYFAPKEHWIIVEKQRDGASLWDTQTTREPKESGSSQAI